MGIIKILASDIRAAYGCVNFWVCIKSVLNPSILAVIVVRAATRLPGYKIWRLVLLVAFSCDIGKNSVVGPGLRLPHPVGVVIGDGVQIGEKVTLYQNVTLGLGRNGYPTIENGVHIYPGAVVVDSIVVGTNAKIGALSFVNSHVPPNEVVTR